MKILVVDDEKNIRESVDRFLSLEGYEVVTAADGEQGRQLLVEEHFDLAVMDLKMPHLDGLELLRWLRNEGLEIPVIMISAFGEITDAVEAMKAGANDYVVKPFDPEELLVRIRNVRKSVMNEKKIRSSKLDTTHMLIGESHEIKQIKKVIQKVAAAPSSVLILGDSGTGKEVVAHQIHALSNRAGMPFVPINLGGLPDALIESELFGYEKGAFTGAMARKTGLFETASGGTIFLDEIGELPIHLQVKLLRVLQERKIMRLGSTLQIPVDIKVIAATNRDLLDEIANGNFREDLYYRLNVVSIVLPPLRERRDDIPLLVEHFINRFNLQFGKKIKGFTKEAMAVFLEYPFLGNIRELENAIERAFIFCENEFIDVHDLSLSKAPSKEDENKNLHGSSHLSMKEMERLHIERVLAQYDGNRSSTAEALGFRVELFYIN